MARNHKHKSRSLFWLIFPFVFLALIIALYSAFWVYMRGQLETGIDEWIKTERARGARIEFKEKTLGGYPFRFALDVKDPTYQPAHGSLWEGETLQLVMQPWNWQHVIGRSPGLNVITDTSGMRHSAMINGKSAASLSWTKDGIRRFGLQLEDMDAVIAGDPLLVKGLSLNLAPLSGNRDDLRIALQWDEVKLPAPLREVQYLGDTLQPSRLIAEIDGFYPALEDAGGDIRQVPTQIIRRGGALHIGQLLLNWGPLKFGAKGDVEAAGGVLNGELKVRIDEGESLQAALEEAGAQREIIAGVAALNSMSAGGEFLTLPIKDNGIYFLGNKIADMPIDGS